MNRDTSQSKRRIGYRSQILKTEEELRCSRSVGAKKRAMLRYVNQGASVPPPSLCTLPGVHWEHSSGSGSSRPRPPSPPPANSSLNSGYVDYVTTDSEDSSNDEKVVECNFVASDEAGQRTMVRMICCLERPHFNYVSKEEKDPEDALRLSKHQEEEKRARSAPAPASRGGRGDRP